MTTFTVFTPELHTHHKITDDHDHHEDNQTHGLSRHFHAVPHGLDPLATQHPEDNQEGVKEVIHVPAGQLAVRSDFAHAVLVALPK